MLDEQSALAALCKESVSYSQEEVTILKAKIAHAIAELRAIIRPYQRVLDILVDASDE